MSFARFFVRAVLAIGLVLSLVAVSQPLTASAETGLVPKVTQNAKTGDQEVYVWDAKAEIGYKVANLTSDDLLNFASAPKGTTIQFAALYNRGTVSLTYQGDGRYFGAYQGANFYFERGAAKGIAVGDWNCWELAGNRVKELTKLGRTDELAVAQAVWNVLSPQHEQLALIAEKEAGAAVVAKISKNKDTGSQDVWVWLPKSKAGFKLFEMAKDDLMDFASAPVGTTIKFQALENRGPVTLTYNGAGKYTIGYWGSTFVFTRDDMAGIPLGDPACLAQAKLRVPALQNLGRSDELNIAQAVLGAIEPKK